MDDTDPHHGTGRALRVLIADDHHLVREGLVALMQTNPDIDVVGEASDGNEAVRLVLQTMPDVAILDVSMSGLSGIEALRQIRATCPHVKVLMVSVHSDEDLVTEALRRGASGYILKSSAGSELFQAIRSAATGQMYMSPQVARVVADGFLGRLPKEPHGSLTSLTPRQLEVLQLLAEGLTTKQIAVRLSRSLKTVEMHRHNIMTKLGCESIADLTRYAIRKGLVSLDP